MYKRRKKLAPAASSTLINETSSKSRNLLSSQSSIVSSISVDNRSTSPDDMFNQSPEKSTCSNGSSTTNGSQNNLGKRSNNFIDEVRINPDPIKNTSSEVLKMLISSDDSEPLPKVPQKVGVDPEKRILSQSITVGPLKNFYETFANAGMIVGRKGEPNLLRKSQFAFVRNLSRILDKNSSESSNVDWFVENLEQYLSDQESLKAALSPTKNHPDVNLPGDCLECLIQLLLSIEPIQAKIISFLLDKIAEYSVIGDESGSDEPLTIVRMILHSMRYLTKVTEPEAFTLKLFDLIHSVSSSMLKHEIISCLPDIISDSQREQTATELMDLMKSEPHLSPSILYTLSNRWLEPESVHQLQISLIRNLCKTSIDQLPAFIRFITSGDITQHADEIINGLRSELVICHPDSSSTQAKQASQSDISSTIFLIFEKLRDSVLKSKKLADLWLKNIEKVKTASYHKPIDLIMLLILHTLTPDANRKRAVETVFKNKTRIGHFPEALVQDTLSVALVIIKEHFSGLLKLLSSLLLSPDLTVSNFSAFFYTECFVCLDSMSRKMIILELKDNVNMSKGNAKPALGLLHGLVSKHPEKVAPFFTLIMLLLDSVDEMRVFEVRELMDTLCILAFGDPDRNSFDTSATQDELCMIIQKQLACPNPSLFRSGIVSGVVIIKHMVKLKENQSNETPSSEEEDIPLSPMAQKALNLFELILMRTKRSAEAQVLLFDQFSHIIMTSEHMDKCFMKKISLLMQGLLQNDFITTCSSWLSKENGLESSLQFCIDSDFEDPIVFNLVDAVVLEAKSSQTQVPLVALPGLVRVIRGLELADLTEIDALLGCAVSLPSPGLYTSFCNVEPYIQGLALDCLFHASNWFREMLNSFVFLIKEGSPDKILQRLRVLVHFQNLISLCLPQSIAYSPPKYYFEDGEGKSSAQADKRIRVPAGGRKKQKKKEERGDDESVDETAVESEDEKETELVTLEFSKFKQHLRELDFDVCLILTQTLTLSPQAIKDGVCSKELGPSELLLLLEDLDAKLRYCLGPWKVDRPRSSVGFDNLASVPLDLIVRNTSKLVHHLLTHLQVIIEYLHNLITVHDGILDAPGMFCPGSHEIKQCLALILSIFNTYLSWPDLESEAYMKCLLKCLIKLAGPNFEKKDATSKNAAVKGALIYLRSLGKCMLDLTSAVSLVNLIKTVDFIRHDEDEPVFKVGIAELCGELLERKWYDGKGAPEKGAKANPQQTILLDLYLSELDNVTATLTWLTTEVDSLTSADSMLVTFPHFNKSNLNILIRSLCKGLLNGLKLKLERQDPKTQLEIWDSILNNLQSLIGIIKIHDSRINLRQFLKGCLPIMRYFLSHGMSVCSTMFKIESIEVSQSIKKLQVITRYIQSICNYSKVNKDNSLIHQLPGMRGTLEKILLSVKNMVLQNKCTDAFFMGSMRHKDIHGEIISTEEGEDKGESEELAVTETNETGDASDNESSASQTEEPEEHNTSMSDTC